MSKFFVTTVNSKDAHGSSRCIGYFDSLKAAIHVATKNPAFLAEAGHYDQVVIEEVAAGMYSYCHPEDQIWFKFEKQKGKLVAVKIPNPYKSTVGWSIG